MTKFGSSLSYPPSPRGADEELFHGRRIGDPYRWLEDPDSPQVALWIKAQNALTDSLLSGNPWRQALLARLTQLQQFERRTPAACVQGTLYHWRNTGLQRQPVLWAEALDGSAERVVLDANELSADGTVAVADVAVSPDGRWLAYAVADGGSDWRQWRVRDLCSLQDMPDRLDHARFSGAAWLRDSSGFVYGRYGAPARGRHAALIDHELHLHHVGNAQETDTLLYKRADQPRWVYSPHMSRCGRWLVVRIWDGSANHRVHLVDLHAPDRKPLHLLDEGHAAYFWVGSTAGGELLFHTDALGGTGAVIAIDPQRPQRSHWRTVVAPGPQRLESAVLNGAHLVLCTLHDGASELHRMQLDSGAREPLPLPALGTASGFIVEDATLQPAEAGALHFNFMSFTVAPTVLRIQDERSAARPWFVAKLPFDGADYETVLEWAESADGTLVPMHITRRRGLVLNGQSPCLLIGYGGFGISQRPGFVASRIAWLEMGGMLVQAMLRGGGEYGRAWHDAARLEHKPRTFEDYIAVAEFLVRSRHTRPQLLVAHGGSNGGLTVAASVLARPDLFGAMVSAVPVLDMLRYQRFGIGAAWASDYGLADKAEQFTTLMQYSPLHNVQTGRRYPATLLLTAERDDRVHPAHAFKFAATMQQAQALALEPTAPVLLRVEQRAGHGAGKSARADVHEKTDLYTFIALALGLPYQSGDLS
ncbi:prolyl oligopeptidase family serine peptidase [Roseateles toxinivorans]|uniref:prolyl oligopeptidase n=1 Tax=Roseateles toxinivorans TaxID=270368 RepID=A0A4R6QNR6_9BURK|nr:prolyl oligopeptidase family serine peptidase [Roseateles toxinivorans]TDP72267.1 prolyl oligopeptidase [Roseateles toxinivorans]